MAPHKSGKAGAKHDKHRDKHKKKHKKEKEKEKEKERRRAEAHPKKKARKAEGKESGRKAGANGGVKPQAPSAQGARGSQQAPAPTTGRKAQRKGPPTQRRGLDGRSYTAGELLIAGGPQTAEEIQYFLRGCVAAEHTATDWAVPEIIAKRGADADPGLREELERQLNSALERFATGPIEAAPPVRPAPRRTFIGVIERAKGRRREIGAFLRGLDLGRTEMSHMDSHGESSLQNLMEWASRIEKLADEEEPEQFDYSQFHRGLDQLDITTEALIVDVELTLRRLRDRGR